MKTKVNLLVLAGVTIAILQSGVLYAMVEKRAMILRNGTMITLRTEPVDPRDLLRGEYVRLGYSISTVDVAKVTGEKPDTKGFIDIYVTVKQAPDGEWGFSSASWQKRTDIPSGEIQIRGQTLNNSYSVVNDIYRVNYGIERYYLPEGWGHAIEDVQKERRIDAVIAVSKAGEAQIRALKDNGRLLYQEPLY
ncbi:GDYXXLXY domain-containing protein [Phyllobacterium sp. 628]|uniref:GDYXXLXY domain-containing protein n=1 Tax=Phyllobacterium sp. 628 TaxID=2718938 RepID=UPI0016627FAA|nr:GDYXXLXY domain-containing protein [Phyllobacterium sp. 628]QND53160.1 GDYXXLXY domain-containing protein [Phyllobacterium sp. 628]